MRAGRAAGMDDAEQHDRIEFVGHALADAFETFQRIAELVRPMIVEHGDDIAGGGATGIGLLGLSFCRPPVDALFENGERHQPVVIVQPELFFPDVETGVGIMPEGEIEIGRAADPRRRAGRLRRGNRRRANAGGCAPAMPGRRTAAATIRECRAFRPG